MLHIGTFHRFRQFSAIDVFQARRTTFVPADLIHLFQLGGRSAGVYRKSCVAERLLLETLILSAQLQRVSHMLRAVSLLVVSSVGFVIIILKQELCGVSVRVCVKVGL